MNLSMLGKIDGEVGVERLGGDTVEIEIGFEGLTMKVQISVSAAEELARAFAEAARMPRLDTGL